MLPYSALRRVQRGLTLIEMMVAMSLGLVVTGVAVGVFVNASRNFSQDETIGRMQENARYALRVLAEDLSMAAFWGEVLDPGKITLGSAPATANCDAWAYTLSPSIQVVGAAEVADHATALPFATAGEVEANTDVLAMKHFAGQRKESLRADYLDDDRIFVRTNNVQASFIPYDHTDTTTTPPPAALWYDWEYVAHIYYIKPGAVPTLFRKKLQYDGTEFACIDEPGGIAEGIQRFHVMWGIDTDEDGTPNRYQASWTLNAVTARISLLARTLAEDVGYDNDKTYTMGLDTSGNPITVSGGGDHYHRRVFTTTVRLRNPATLNQLI